MEHLKKSKLLKVDKEVTCKTTDLKPPLKQRTFVSYLNSLITFFFGFFFLILHASKGINILCCWSSIFLLWFMSICPNPLLWGGFCVKVI